MPSLPLLSPPGILCKWKNLKVFVLLNSQKFSPDSNKNWDDLVMIMILEV